MTRPHGHTLVIGGARSGKSAWAEQRALASGLEPVYLATAQALDGEMERRVARHRTDRSNRWRTVEEPLEVAAVLRQEAAPGRVVLVDCLTLWLTNLLLAGRDPEIAGRELGDALGDVGGLVLLVTNEVGGGIVPINALSRRFVDEAGRLHQRVAMRCGVVVLVVAGLPLALKGEL